MSTTKGTTKIKREIQKLKPEEKWAILMDYMDTSLTNEEVASRNGIRKDYYTKWINKLYKAFQNIKETKTLVATQNTPDTFRALKAQADGEHINPPFLNSLSDDLDPLSDKELLFCEFLMELGDEVRAIERSKLNVGLSQKAGGKPNPTYKDSCKLRAFYLKRKPNVRHYLNSLRSDVLRDVTDGKSFIQSNLITLIEQIKAQGDSRLLPSYLKALEQLARTFGAFDDKVTVETVSGDKALDRMIEKARDAGVEIGPAPIAYVDGVEIYEEEDADSSGTNVPV